MAEYRINIKNEKLYDANGNLFGTSGSSALFEGNGSAVFVMDEFGKIYSLKSPGGGFVSSFQFFVRSASCERRRISGEKWRYKGNYKTWWSLPTDCLSEESILVALNKSGIGLYDINLGEDF